MPRPRKRRAEDAARKVPVSDPARRQRWQPGEDHPLDVMIAESALLEQELSGAVKKVEAATASITSLLGSWEDLATKEEQTRQVFADRFGSIKHADHLQATLAVLRRRRLLTRLQALEEILHLASWLETDIFLDEFMHDLYTALSEQQRQ
ncbi:hypothetical protein ccbrp13_16830 [Ktedonobacteria bacterium brp13]|nr:hypothetical protein ccbrp13_16830 [Ktedonobacteria bacterium brp13]